jgi:hypothetical protein
MRVDGSRARTIVLALAVGVVAALVLSRLAADERPREESRPLVGSTPSASATRVEPAAAMTRAPAAANVARDARAARSVEDVQASPQPGATRAPFDLARLPPRWHRGFVPNDAERFPSPNW